MPAATPAADRILRRDRVLVLAILAIVVLLAWTYLLLGAGMDVPAGPMDVSLSWTPGYVGLVLAMWVLMMTAMMLPSAAPMLLLFATVCRKGRAAGDALRRTAVFGLAYVFVWVAFAVVATGVQWSLERAMLLSPGMTLESRTIAGLVFVAAGAYQLLPLKRACLRHCRSPMEFLAGQWRPGGFGAFRMGLRHGAFCLGCCWMLMGLLFVGGLMNVLWIAALALVAFIEKIAPATSVVSRVIALGLIVWGVVSITAPFAYNN
jgi:predicted metal-binding membrane protein